MMHELTEKIMANIGLDVNDQFNVYDQDYLNLLMMDNKFLKCNYNGKEPIIENHDMYFDPIHNIKIMIFIFSYFLQKYQVLTNNYIMTFYQISNDRDETALQLKGTINITSNYYKSHTLKYIDITLRLSGYTNLGFLKKYDGTIK